jgi:hypothetical protein
MPLQGSDGKGRHTMELILAVKHYLMALEAPKNPLMKNLMPQFDEENALEFLREVFAAYEAEGLVKEAEDFIENELMQLEKSDTKIG